MAVPDFTDPNGRRYYGSHGAALNVISRAVEDARIVRIATAYFEPSGYRLLRDALRGKEVRLIVGRPEGGEDRVVKVIEDFIENADHLRTSGFIDDLASLPAEDMSRIRRLPAGIKSFKRAALPSPVLYLLLKSRGRFFPALFDEKGAIMMDSPRTDEIMNLIRLEKEEEPCRADIDADRFNLWVEKARNEWAAVWNRMPHEITVVCRMLLAPGARG